MRCVVDRQKRVAVGDFAWCLSGSNVGGSQSAGCVEDSSARDRYSPASRRFPRVLALEITTARRPAQDRRGHSRSFSIYERRQSSMGSATNSWRTTQTRARCRPDHDRKIYDQEKTVTVARLQDLPSRYRINRHVRGPTISFRQLGGLLVLQHSRRDMAGCDHISDRGTDCPAH